MRTKHLLSSSALAALLLTGGITATASAAPLAPTCADATAAVAVAQDRVQNEAADVRAAEDNLQSANDNLTEALGALDLLRLDAVPDALQAELIATAEAAVEGAEGSVETNERALAAEQAELEDAQADLAAKESIRQRVCGAPNTTVNPPPPGGDKDCSDFPTQRAAQVVLDFDKSDPHNLDANDNGVACEEFFPPVTTTVVPPTVVGDDIIGEDNDVDQRVTINLPDNDLDDGVRFRPNTSGGIATG